MYIAGYFLNFGFEHHVGREEIKQVKNFVYLGRNVLENGRVEVEVRHRIKAGPNV